MVMEACCKRLIFNGVNLPFTFEQIKAPQVKNGILAKILLSSICGSDLHTIRGRRKEVVPCVLGHEGVAQILEDSGDLKAGKRVTFSIFDCCKKCNFCVNGMNQKCIELFKYGHSSINDGTGFNGTYASHIVLRPGTTIVEIPEKVPDFIASTINCALATMIAACRIIPNDCNDSAVVFGDGLLGVYGCAILHSLRKFTNLYCVGNTRIYRKSLLEKLGCTPVYGESLENIKNSVSLVIETCGNKSIIRKAYELLKPGGCMILVGLVHPDSNLNITAEDIIRKCLTIKGIHNYNSNDLCNAVSFLQQFYEDYPFSELIGPVFDLNEYERAFEAVESKKHFRVYMKSD